MAILGFVQSRNPDGVVNFENVEKVKDSALQDSNTPRKNSNIRCINLRRKSVCDLNETDTDKKDKKLFINSKYDPKKEGPDARRSSFVHQSSSAGWRALCPMWLCPCFKNKRGNLDHEDEVMAPLILVNYTKSTPEKTPSAWWVHRSYEWQPRYLEHMDILHIGHYSEVGIVQHRKTKELAALKTIFKNSKEHSFYEVERSVRVEKSILEYSRGNPLFVELKAFYETSDRWCFIMDFMPLGDLATFIKENQIEEGHLIFLCAQLVSALHFLHKQGIIHRDVKPENVLLDRNGLVKLIDFGFANIGRLSKRVCGTPIFMAPEMLAHQEYSFSVDWWSFGIIIFECLTGTTPIEMFLKADFSDYSEEEVFQLCRQGCHVAKNAIPPTTGPELRSFLTGLLEVDPKNRLGCKPGIGFFEIWSHPYFSAIDMDKMSSKGSHPFPLTPKQA